MKRTASYLQPSNYFSNEQLRDSQAFSDLCVLVPSYNGPNPQSRFCIESLATCGATVVASYSCSDVALHRALVAGRTMTVLKANPKLKWVLWVDDDMSFTPAHIAFLVFCSASVGHAVTGKYCRRGNPNVVAMQKLSFELLPKVIGLIDDVLRLNVNASRLNPNSFHPVQDRVLYEPCLPGMGALVLSAEQFVRHCESVPRCQIDRPNEPPSFVYGICSSGMMSDRMNSSRWVSEDESYSISLWHKDVGVFAVPVAFGHYSNVPLVPSPNAIWLGESTEDD